MASSSSMFNFQSKVKVQSAKLTQQSMLQKLVEHGCIDLSPSIDPGKYSELPRHGGGYGDIYRSKMWNGHDIAVKVWRRFTDVDPSIAMKRCMREIYTWSKLKHENIHELLGVTQHLGQLGMVSVWMTHGDLATYILNNPDANRNPWCIQVATGVLYLHTNETVHGDLKACNILLSNDLVAKISDFDSSLASDNSMTFSATGELRNTLRWTAPELLNDSEDDEVNTIQKTKESDIYALAMTLLEIKTGRFPYAEYRDNNRVLRALLEKRLPKRPKEIYEFSDGRSLWDLLISCWNHNPTARPGAQCVLQLLKLEIEPPEDEGPAIFGNHLSLQQIFNILVNLGCVDLSSKMDPRQNIAMIENGGGFGDVWKGKLRNGDDIAVKTWRATLIDHKHLKSASREIYEWSRLKHPNIHSVMGVILFQQEHLGVVSHWMHGGNLEEFIRKNPHIDRYQKCIEVTSGLEYAHRNKLVHGNVKAFGVLVTAGGIAKLIDFDFSSVMIDLSFTCSNRYTGGVRWAAPELLEDDEPRTTKQADIYALGMTMLEIFTGEVPFSDRRTNMAVMSAVLRGTLPTRPTNLPENGERTSKMWQLMLSCWDRDPVARPTATEVLDSLNTIYSLPA